MADQNLTEQSEIVKSRLRGWNRFLKWFVLFVVVVAICKMIVGCTSAPQPYPYKVGKPWCRHNAILAAAVCGEFYPVSITVGKTPGGGHAQARCKIEGKWEWLQVRNGEVYVGVEEGPFTSERRDMSIESYVQLMDVSYPLKREGQGQ